MEQEILVSAIKFDLTEVLLEFSCRGGGNPRFKSHQTQTFPQQLMWAVSSGGFHSLNAPISGTVISGAGKKWLSGGIHLLCKQEDLSLKS